MHHRHWLSGAKQGSSLRSIIDKKHTFTSQQIQTMVADLDRLNMMMNDRKIVLNDMKPDNLLVDPATGHIKVIDIEPGFHTEAYQFDGYTTPSQKMALSALEAVSGIRLTDTAYFNAKYLDTGKEYFNNSVYEKDVNNINTNNDFNIFLEKISYDVKRFQHDTVRHMIVNKLFEEHFPPNHPCHCYEQIQSLRGQ